MKQVTETFSVVIEGQTHTWTKSEVLPQGIGNVLSLVERLGLKEEVTGTYSIKIEDVPVKVGA